MILAMILLLATGLRSHHLGEPSLWIDEVATAFYSLSGQTLQDVITRPLAAPIPAPPGLFVVTFLFTRVGTSEFLLRLPAAFFGILGIALTYKVGAALFGEGEGLIAALLLAVSRFHLHFSQEARYYAILACFALLSLYCFWRALHALAISPENHWAENRWGRSLDRAPLARSETGQSRDTPAAQPAHRRLWIALRRGRWWLGTIVATLAAVYTHLFGLFVPLVQALYVGYLWGRERLATRRGNTYGRSPSQRRAVRPFLLSGLVVIVGYMPMLPFLVAGVLGPRGLGGNERLPLTWEVMSTYFGKTIRGFGANDPLVIALFAGLALAGIAALAVADINRAVLIALWVLLPVAVVALLRPAHFFSPKYVIFVLPVYLMTVGHGIIVLSRHLMSSTGRMAILRVYRRMHLHWARTLHLGSGDPSSPEDTNSPGPLTRFSDTLLSLMIVLVIAVVSAASVRSYYDQHRKEDWRSSVHFLRVVVRPDDCIIAAGSKVAFGARASLLYAFEYYGLSRADVTLRAESPYGASRELATRYASCPRVWVVARRSPGYRLLRKTWIADAPTFYFGRMRIALVSNDPRTDREREEEIEDLYRLALFVKDDKRSRLSLANFYARGGRWTEAQAEYSRAIEQEPGQGHVLLLPGWFRRARSLPKEAEAEYQMLSRLLPADHRAHLALGRLLAWQNRDAEALAAFNRATGLAPERARPHMTLGQFYAAQGQPDQALIQFHQAADHAPRRARPHLLLGWIYLGRGGVEQAVAEFETAARLKPQWGMPHLALGQLHLRQGRPEDAIAEYQQVSHLRPDRVRPYLVLERLYRAQGRWEEAISALQAAVKRGPEKAGFHFRLSKLYATVGEGTQAEAELLTAIALDPMWPQPHILLGRLYQAQGREAEAQRERQIASELREQTREQEVP